MCKYQSCKFTFVGKRKNFKHGMIGASVDTELHKEFIKLSVIPERNRLFFYAVINP